MKRTPWVLVMLTLTLISKSQNLIIDSTEYKAGIYRTFEEFKFNNPSIEFNYKVTTKSRGYGFLTAAGKVNFYYINIDKKLGKSIGEVFGFCDGKNVYINEYKPKLTRKSDFMKIEYFGKYCYYQDISSTTINTGTGYSTTISLDEKIIDINSGEVTHLNKGTLRNIIEGNAELLNQFNDESKKKKKLKEYLIRFLENQ